MKAEEFLQLLFDLEQEHKSDRDGGYSFVSSLASEIGRLTSAEQALVRDYLILIIVLQAPKWWSIAAETLAEMKHPEDAERLFQLMGYLPQAFQDSIFGTLLRIAPASTESFVRQYIQGAINRGNVSALVWLAHYYRIQRSPEVIRWIAQTFVAFFSVSELEEKAVGVIQSVLLNLLEVNPSAVEILVEETERTNTKFARRFKEIVIQQLRQPWLSRYVVPTVLERLVRKITATGI